MSKKHEHESDARERTDVTATDNPDRGSGGAAEPSVNAGEVDVSDRPVHEWPAANSTSESGSLETARVTDEGEVYPRIGNITHPADQQAPAASPAHAPVQDLNSPFPVQVRDAETGEATTDTDARARASEAHRQQEASRRHDADRHHKK